MKHRKQPSKLAQHAVIVLATVAVFITAAFTPIEPAMVVVIDAGHGGKDPGNLGTGRYSLTEKDVTLDISTRLAAYIHEKMPDVKVILTRDVDTYRKLESRVKIANEAEADVFISIHCDAFAKSSVVGCGSYVMGLHKSEESLRVAMQENAYIYQEEDYATTYEGFDPNDPDTYIALALRQNIYLDQSLQLGALIQDQFKNRVGRKDRGVKQAGFYVISFTTMPSVLVELGFLTNNIEEDFLHSEKGRTYMASALYRAFRDYRELQSPAESENYAEPETPINIEFKVQIASSPTQLDKSDPVFHGLQNIDVYLSDGHYKYTIGSFSTATKAHARKRELRKQGFEGAFVAAFTNGKRVPMSSVQIENKTH